MKRLLMVLALALPGALSLGHSDEPRPAAAAVKVPFEVNKRKHILIKATINGTGPYTLMFDSGTPDNLLSARTVKACAMKQRRIDSLETNGLKAANVPVDTGPADSNFCNQLGVDGVLGFAFYSRFKITIDYQVKEITFGPSAYKTPVVTQAHVYGTLKIPNQFLSGRTKWGMAVHKDDNDRNPGVNIKEVFPGSPAAAAGLKAGDRVLILDGTWTDSVDDCYFAAANVKEGTPVKVEIQRDGKSMTLTVKPVLGL